MPLKMPDLIKKCQRLISIAQTLSGLSALQSQLRKRRFSAGM